jgi:hypothetical protein
MPHTKYVCNCSRPRCHFCEGGLILCTVCNGAEGELPADCPGRPMTREEMLAVQAGKLDFHNGVWEKKGA